MPSEDFRSKWETKSDTFLLCRSINRNNCRLKVLYLGGNCLAEIPAEVGHLARLQALVLCENQLESLPSTIAQLKRLRSLLLHKNQLTTLPPQIIALRELMEVISIHVVMNLKLFLSATDINVHFLTILAEFKGQPAGCPVCSWSYIQPAHVTGACRKSYKIQKHPV